MIITMILVDDWFIKPSASSNGAKDPLSGVFLCHILRIVKTVSIPQRAWSNNLINKVFALPVRSFSYEELYQVHVFPISWHISFTGRTCNYALGDMWWSWLYWNWYWKSYFKYWIVHIWIHFNNFRFYCSSILPIKKK